MNGAELDALWKEMAATAVVGTERQAFAARAGNGFEELLAAPGANQEEGFLRAAAVIGLCRNAGTSPRKCELASLAIAEQDTLPTVTPRAARLLQRVLEEEKSLAEEWIALAAAAQKLAAPEALPALLAIGTREIALREKVMRIVGARGRWLAAQNEDWEWLLRRGEAGSALPDERLWLGGEKKERIEYLQNLRAVDAPQARTKLQEVWKGEQATTRRDLLECLRVNLSPEDEPFLESCLDDRSKEARAAAASLLSCLPESAFAGRMIQRAARLSGMQETGEPAREEGMVSRFLSRLRKPEGSEPRSINAPEALDPEAARDSIGVLKPPPGRGERANWLKEIIALTPLAFWEQRYGAPPDRLIKSVANSDWKDAIIEGWLQAAMNQRNGDWAIATAFMGELGNEVIAPHELLNTMGPERYDELICRYFEGREKVTPVKYLHYALPLQRTWSERLTRILISGLKVINPKKLETHNYTLLSGLGVFGRRGHVKLFPEFAEYMKPGAEAGALPPSISTSLNIYELRHEILKEMEK